MLGETPLSTGGLAAVTIGAGHNSVSYGSSVPPAYSGYTAARIYRTKKNGSVFYFLAEITDFIAAFHDHTPDSSLGAEYIPCHVPPAEARFVLIGPDDRAYWFGRTGANASVVEVSEVGWPDRILDDDFFTINNNDGDVITAGCKVPGGILFFKRNSTWLVRQYGSAPINISYYYGCTAPWSIQVTPDGCIFLSQQGKVCVYNGSIDEIAWAVRPELKALSEAAMSRVVSAYHEDIYILAYDFRGQRTYNTRILEFDMLGKKWMGPHTNQEYLTPGYFCVLDSVKDLGQLLWLNGKASTGSWLYEMDSNSFSDNGDRFVCTATTGQGDLAGFQDKEVIRSLIRGQFSQDSALEVNLLVNGEKRINSYPLVSDTSIVSSYGVGVYGTSKYGGLNYLEGEDSFDIPAKGKILQVEITDGGRGSISNLDGIELIVKSHSEE